MSPIHRQVKKARNAIWLNMWFEAACRLLAGAAALFAVVVLVVRLEGWRFPLPALALVLLGLTLVGSLVWSRVKRPSSAEAAAALDKAAGLRERVSSSLYCEQSDDPFAQAVCVDAESRTRSLTVRQHLRPRFPQSGATAGVALALAALMFVVPRGLLQSAEAKAERKEAVAVEHTRAEIKKQMTELKKIAHTNPALADLKDQLDKLQLSGLDKMEKPEAIRDAALKRIDEFADAVKQKLGNDRYERVAEMKKMLRGLEEPKGTKTDVQKLTREMASGDFKAAQQTIKQMQEQLATLQKEGDKQFAEAMQKQLDQLSKQLEKVGSMKELEKQLEQAGVKKEDIQRMLEHLTKEDVEQIKKELEKQGLNQQQIQQAVEKIKKQQSACKSCQKMAQAMSNAASGIGAGQMQSAADGLESAGEQLSQMESLEQEMQQLQSTLAQLQGMKGQCSGNQPGMGDGNKKGPGMGDLGQGRGGLAQSEETPVGFKIERDQVKTTKGKIIGQFLVDGEQVKGEMDPEFAEVVAAAERDATDTINRDRIPRQYQKAVREYFSRLPAGLGMEPQDGPREKAPGDEAATGSQSGAQEGAGAQEEETIGGE